MKPTTETQSSIGTYANCPAQYHFAYEHSGHGLEPYIEKEYFTWGNVGHEALAELYSGRSPTKVQQYIERAYYEAKRKPFLSPEHIQTLEVDQAAVQGCIAAYAVRYNKEITKGIPIKMTSFGLKFRFPLRIRAGKVYISGEIDQVGTHHKSRRTYLIEDKFPGYLSRNIVDEYAVSLQTLVYLIGYYECYAKPNERLGVFYRYTRKPAIRQKKTESKPQFIQRTYDEYTNRPEHYFHRALVKRTPKQIMLYKQEIINILNTLHLSRHNEWWYRNRKACLAKGRCAFFDPCHNGQTPDVMARFKLKGVKHVELEVQK